MGLVPLFLILMISDERGWAFAVFLTAGMTDALDGLIARVWKQKTELGAYLDPVADKMLLMTAVLCLALLNLPNRIPLWVAILFVARDVILLISVAIIVLTTPYRTFTPAIAGKITTFLQLALVVDTLFYHARGEPSPHFNALLWLAFTATALSIIQYTARASRILAGAENKPKS